MGTYGRPNCPVMTDVEYWKFIPISRYQAIQFGSEKMGEGLVIMDKETGQLLGGKKAAIQFYYDKQGSQNCDLQV